MPKCPECGEDYEPPSRRCPFCNAPQPGYADGSDEPNTQDGQSGDSDSSPHSPGPPPASDQPSGLVHPRGAYSLGDLITIPNASTPLAGDIFATRSTVEIQQIIQTSREFKCASCRQPYDTRFLAFCEHCQVQVNEVLIDTPVCTVKCWDDAEKLCKRCSENGWRRCRRCDSIKRARELTACSVCGEAVCDDPTCWCLPQRVCLRCEEHIIACEVCGGSVPAHELKPCSECGKIVCGECFDEATQRCLACIEPRLRALQVAIPCSRSVAIHSTDDMSGLGRIACEHQIRSVGPAKWQGETALLCGWRGGVYVVHPLEGCVMASYESTAEREPRYGFNSAAIIGEVLYAGHRELGLCRWELASGKFEGFLWADSLGIDGEYVSCVTAGEDGVLWFGAGPQLFALSAGAERPTAYEGFTQEIWSIAATEELVAVAGGVFGSPAEGGMWAVWDRTAPPKPLICGCAPAAAGMAVARLPDSECLACVSRDGQVYDFGADGAWSDAGRVNLPQVRAVACHGSYIAIAGRESGDDATRILVWDHERKKVHSGITGDPRCISIVGRISSIALAGT